MNKTPNSISAARTEAMNKRISAHPNTYVITENRRKGLVTVTTASGIHVGTMRRSAAIRDGLIKAHSEEGQMKGMKPTATRAPAKAKGAKRRETKSQSFAHLASAPAEPKVDRNAESGRAGSWDESFRRASRIGPTAR